MPKVLVVEDDPQQAQLRRQLLELGGCEVVCARGPAEALARCPGAEVILTDLRFPGPTGEPEAAAGLALISRLRAKGCAAPIVVLSGWPEEIYGSPQEGLVSAVLVKPVAFETLLDLVKRLAATGSASAPSRSLPSDAT